MCNSHNHSASCTCGFGGYGHFGGGCGPLTERYEFQPRSYNSSVQEYCNDDVCAPTTCQYCQRDIYFVRHNGGSVWLDELGAPWHKHQCFYPDDSTTVISSQYVPDEWAVGIISRIQLVKKGNAKITLNTLAGKVMVHDYNYPEYYDFISEYLGGLVMVNNQSQTLKKVHTPKPKKQHLELMRGKKMQTTFRLCNGLTASQVKAATFVIYAHKVNGQVYIGKTKDPVLRWNAHYDACRSQTHSENNNPFQKALRNAQDAWTATEHYILAVSDCANEITKFENIAICKYKSSLNATGHWGYRDTDNMFKPLCDWQDTVTLFRNENRDVEWGLAKTDEERDICIARIVPGRTSPTSLVSTGVDGNFPEGYKINCSRAARVGHQIGSYVKVLVSWHTSGNQLVGKKHDVFVPVNIN